MKKAEFLKQHKAIIDKINGNAILKKRLFSFAMLLENKVIKIDRQKKEISVDGEFLHLAHSQLGLPPDLVIDELRKMVFI